MRWTPLEKTSLPKVPCSANFGLNHFWQFLCTEVGASEQDSEDEDCRKDSQRLKTVKDPLVGGLKHFLFFHILGIIIPIDYYFHQPVIVPSH